MKDKYEVVMCIVNSGFSDIVMDAAREVGARGGTVIHARGTANKEAEKYFHITIQPDKDIVMILVPAAIKDAVLHAVYQNAGLKSEGQGIAFSMPVDDVVGLTGSSIKMKKDAQPAAEKADKKDGTPPAEKADKKDAQPTAEKPEKKDGE